MSNTEFFEAIERYQKHLIENTVYQCGNSAGLVVVVYDRMFITRVDVLNGIQIITTWYFGHVCLQTTHTHTHIFIYTYNITGKSMHLDSAHMHI